MADKIVQLKDGNGNNLYPIGVGGYDVYSTSETVIGKWIDGKPIYRRVFQYTLSGSSWNTVGTITGIGEVTHIYGACKRPNGIQTEFPRSTMDTYIETNGTIHVRDTEGNGGTVKCIVEYTKSN